MKKYIILFVHLFFVSVAFAQAPNNINYQGVVRKSDGSLLSLSKVAFKFRIHQNTTSGPVVYEETQTVSTNKDGLATLKIGAGTPTLGAFSAIDWSTGLYFVRTFIDINGGSNFVLFSVSQFSSVPFAFFSTEAGSVDYANVTNAPNIDSLKNLIDETTLQHSVLKQKVDSLTKGHFVGERFGGGIVFYVYDNGQHGLIYSPDTVFKIPWYVYSTIEQRIAAGAYYNGVNAGRLNSEIIVNTVDKTGAVTVAGIILDLGILKDGIFYDDWYLPSIKEVELMVAAGVRVPFGIFSSTESSTNSEFLTMAFDIGNFRVEAFRKEVRSCHSIPIRSF